MITTLAGYDQPTELRLSDTIRRRVLIEGVSRRQVQRETGMHWKTLRKVLEHSVPPGYRQSRQRPKRKIERWFSNR